MDDGLISRRIEGFFENIPERGLHDRFYFLKGRWLFHKIAKVGTISAVFPADRTA